MPSQREITLKEAIDKYIDAFKMRAKFDEKSIEKIWPEVVGSAMATHTKEMKFSDGKLYVKTNSSVARQELSFMRSRLVIAINRKLGKKLLNEIIVL